jgi:hypothetical protein
MQNRMLMCKVGCDTPQSRTQMVGTFVGLLRVLLPQSPRLVSSACEWIISVSVRV